LTAGLGCEVELSSTSQASLRLSAIVPDETSADAMYDVTTRFFPTIPYFTDGMVEISHQFEHVGDPSHMSLATGDYEGGI